jgi:phytol kinase
METQDIIALILVYLIIAAALGLSQFVQKKGWNWDVRKIVHIGVGAFIYVWWAFTANWIMLVFFAIPFEIILFLAMFPGNPVSDSKLGAITSDMGHRYGLFLYVMTIIVMVAFFFDHWLAATIAIVAMTRGDGFGSVIGRKFGKHKIINGKSAEGSLAVFFATFIVSLIIIAYYGWLVSQGMIPMSRVPYVTAVAAVGYAALAGIIASVAEAVVPGDLDNIVIPVCIAVVLVLLGL